MTESLIAALTGAFSRAGFCICGEYPQILRPVPQSVFFITAAVSELRTDGERELLLIKRELRIHAGLIAARIKANPLSSLIDIHSIKAVKDQHRRSLIIQYQLLVAKACRDILAS